MLTVRILVLGLMMQGGAAFAQAQPGEVFAGLTGSCWRTQMDGAGPNTDTHCFEAAVGGKMVTDTHKVRTPKGEVIYEGVSVYLLDKPSGAVVYEYFYSNGESSSAMAHGLAMRSGSARSRDRRPLTSSGDFLRKLTR